MNNFERMKRFMHFIVILLLFAQCSKEEWQLAEGEYVFIETVTERYGKLLEGDPGHGVGAPFCCPTYGFNPATGELMGDVVQVNTALKVVFGGVTLATGVIGLSMSSGLTGLYDLSSEIAGQKVDGIEEGGIVHLSFNNDFHHFSGKNLQPVTLHPNEEWTTVLSIDTVTYQMSWGDVVVEITKMYEITNYGILKKADIIHN